MKSTLRDIEYSWLKQVFESIHEKKARAHMDHLYDVIILGAGPAGLSAGLYAGRSRLDTLIIEKGQAGGQIINTDEIENYPGQIVEGETGVSLVRRMYEQTEQFGAEHVRDTITEAELDGDIKVLTGEKYHHCNRCIRKTDRMQR